MTWIMKVFICQTNDMKKNILMPKMDDSGFFRNRTEIVRVISTDETSYPKCKVRWLIPCVSSKMDVMDMDVFQKKEFSTRTLSGFSISTVREYLDIVHVS